MEMLESIIHTARDAHPKVLTIGSYTFLIAFGLLLFTAGAVAEEITWMNTGGGAWQTAANWDPEDVPNASGEEGLVPDDSFTYTVDLGANLTLDKITLLNPNATLNVFDWDLNFYHDDGLTNYGTVVISGGDARLHANQHNEAGGVFNVMDGGQLRKSGGTLTNNGTIYLNPDALSSPAVLHVESGASLNGSGEMVMTTAGNADGAQINTYYTTLYHGLEHTIRGDGQISAAMTNDGTIRADRPGTPLYLVSYNKTNNGVMEAVDGAELYFENLTITQGVDGVIRADNGLVTFQDPTRISYGNANTLNGGAIEVRGTTTFTEVTNHGDLHVLDGQHLTIQTGLTNNGQILVNSDLGDANAYLYWQSAPYLEGTGEIVMQTNGDPDDAYLQTYATTMTQGGDHTIRGGGRIHSALTNNGTVRADRPGDPLWLYSNNKTNNNLMEATGGGELVIGTGTITQGVSGVIRADGSKVALQTSANINGGTLESTGGGEFECQAVATMTNVDNQSQINVLTGQGLHVQQGMVNDAQIVLRSDEGDGNSYLQFYSAPTLSGSGEILMNSAGEADDACIYTYYTTVTQGPNHTMRGSGGIYASLVNDGTIPADDPGASLHLLTGAKTNNGLMEASDGGTLAIGNGAITQGVSGVIQADDGTVALQTSASVTGGSLASSNGGRFECQAVPSMTNVNTTAQIDILNGQGLNIYQGMVHDGQIVIHSDAGEGNSYFQFCSAPSLEGTCEILMRTEGDPLDAGIYSYYTTGTQGPDHTIRGSGTINGAMVNNGTVRADDPVASLYLTSNAKTNNGVMEAVDGAQLVLNSGIITQGETGLFRADNATVGLVDPARIVGGSLETINGGTVECWGHGTLRLVTNNGDVDIPSGSTLDYEAGITNHGRIVVNSDHGVNATAFRATSGPRIEGTGEIILQAEGGDLYTAQLNQYYTSFSQGPDHTIRGTGVIPAQMSNDGVLLADQPNAILETTTTFINNGTVAAVDTGIVRCALMNQHMNGGTMTGGSWYAGPGSMLRLIGAHTTNLNAEFILDGLGSAIYSDDGTTRALTNLARIDSTGHLSIQNGRDFATPAELHNYEGRLSVAKACSLIVNGTYTQEGWNPAGHNYDGHGWTEVNGVLWPIAAAPIDMQAGTLSGNGTVVGWLVSGARVDPGTSVGELTVDGSYTQTEDGALYIEIGGREEGEYDHLHVSGPVELAGTIWIRMLEGFTAVAGDTFQVLSCDSRTGFFDVKFGSPGIGLQYDVHHYDTHVTIELYGDVSEVEDPLDDSADDTPGDPLDEEPVDPFTPDEPLIERFTSRVAPTGAELHLALPEPAEVNVRIFDFNGRHVATLGNASAGVGVHTYRWDGHTGGGQPVASGVFFGRAEVTRTGRTKVHNTRVLIVR